MASAALIITAVSATASVRQARITSKEQQRQIEIRNRIEATKRVRNIKRAVASARIRRGEVEAAGFDLGVQGGTAAQGAGAGITSGLASSVAAANQQFTGQQAIGASQSRIASSQALATTFGAISSLAGQFTGGVGTQGAQNRAAFSELFDFGG